MTERQRRTLLDVIDALIDAGYHIRHPLVVKLCGLLEVGPDVQEDGE